MSNSTENWLRDLLRPNTESDKESYRNWGFTIYRTAYDPPSEQAWQRLLQTIQTRAYEEALSITYSAPDDPEFQEIWSLFRLDARSDAALAGLDMEQLRSVYDAGNGGEPMNADYPTHRVFLLADDEVLADVGADIVKCVDANYRAADYASQNPRLGGQRYFGWMPMKAGSAAELWTNLDMRFIDEIAPLTIGGSHLVVWDGGC
jgi:hypothetical protein